MTASDITETPAAIGSFADVPLRGEDTGPAPTPEAVTEQIGVAAAAHGYTAEQLIWSTPEGIDVKPVYIG
ncbi:MAG: methylmalonyl-CoA mutase, partial [Mycobacterium sp.]|nr:methylmalonyl-CoA mutase [Mycobacterium sp.]